MPDTHAEIQDLAASIQEQIFDIAAPLVGDLEDDDECEVVERNVTAQVIAELLGRDVQRVERFMHQG